MSKVHHKDMISSDEARIMLLEQRNDDFHQTLMRIEKRLDNMDAHINARFDNLENRIEKLDSRIDSNFKWILGFVIPGFLGILGLMAHGFHWLP